MMTNFETLKNTDGCYVARPSGSSSRAIVIGLIDQAYKESIKERIDNIYPEKISGN